MVGCVNYTSVKLLKDRGGRGELEKEKKESSMLWNAHRHRPSKTSSSSLLGNAIAPGLTAWALDKRNALGSDSLLLTKRLLEFGQSFRRHLLRGHSHFNVHRITWRACENRGADSGGCGQWICISDKFPGEADASGPRITLWKLLIDHT